LDMFHMGRSADTRPVIRAVSGPGQQSLEVASQESQNLKDRLIPHKRIGS